MAEGGFRFLEHISEAYIEAYGKNLEEAFEYAAKAMFEVMTDTSKVEARVEEDVEVEGEDKEALLMEWLSELLYRYGAKNMVYSKFKVSIEKTDEGYRLKGKAWGEEFDPQKHPSRTEVKAVTYSLMEIEEKEGRATVKFVLDI